LKLLVTGATGFVGGAICRELAARGDRVKAFHRVNSDTSLLDDLPVEHQIGDLNDPASLRIAVKGVDAVIHCAAQLGSHADWQLYDQVTIKGTRAILEAARDARVRRFIHTSSVAALGVPESGPSRRIIPLISESHTWNYLPHRWPYGYAKYLAELEVQHAVALGLDAVIVNPSSVFGAGDLQRKESSVIHMVADRGLRLSAPGGMNVVHISDVVQGHLAALEYGRSGERYILGGENIPHDQFFLTILEIAGIQTRLVKLPLSLVRVMRKLFFITSRLLRVNVNPGILNLAGFYFYYDLEKSMRELGLPLPRSTRLAIDDTYRWFKEHPIQ
jgi:dihydroflavonol-4-reductase